MAHAYLTPKNIFKLYEQDKEYTDTLTKPFDEFARIARNRPHDGIDPAYPKTTDGTTASIIQKTPKRVVQQLPTGVIEGDEAPEWLKLVAQFVYTEKILPYANEDYGLFEKSHLVIESGLTFGFGASLAPFLNHGGYFCPDMVLPYWGDITIQKGKKSGPACRRVFIRSWWQKSDIDALIDSEEKLAAEAKKRGETYESTWDIAALKEVRQKLSTKDQQAMTPAEQERGNAVDGIEFVTGFQEGVGAKFYTFEVSTKKIVRTKVNKDPRGKIPVDWFYGDIDGTNPLGRGIVELIGGLQNLIDSDMQMYQYNRALALAPPVLKIGEMGDFRFAPNAVIEATDLTAKLEPITIDTTALAKYPELYGLQKSQLLNLVSSPDTSISAEIGNPGFGKTPTAINQQQAMISVDDNAIRKRFESWFEGWSETAINLYFAERSGIEIIKLDEDTANKLRQLEPTEDFDPNTALNDKNELVINYDTATPALKFRVDASTSKMKDDTAQLQALTGLLETLENNQVLAGLIVQRYPDKVLSAWNRIVASSGVEDPENLSIDIDEFKEQQEQEMLAQQYQAEAQAQAQAQQAMIPAQQPAAPVLGEVQPGHIDELRQLGFSDEQIAQAIQQYRAEQGVGNA